MTNFYYLILIPLLPLLGAMYNGFFGLRLQNRFNKNYVHIPAIASVVLSFVISLAGFLRLAGDSGVDFLYFKAWQWLAIGNLEVNFAFVMDHLSSVMCLVITFVGSLIHIFSTGYMKDDPSYWRFFSYLNLFMFSMLILVLGDNFLVMFIGWEGVGLCSYLLIGFWYKDENNTKAGNKAFIVNRVGDFGFVIGIFILFWTLASLQIDQPSLVFNEIQGMLHDAGVRKLFLGKVIFGMPAVTLICLAFLWEPWANQPRFLYISGCPMPWQAPHLCLL
jgi:NADH-quinone oxidoreductase subunit L